MSKTAYMDIAPKTQTKSLKEELREERRIGKMTTSQILAYVGFRHRLFLTTFALVVTNTGWIVSLAHR